MFISAKYYWILFALGLSYIAYLSLVFWRTKVPYVATPKRYFAELFARFSISPNSVIYDLGSGQGDFLFAAEVYKPKKLVGYELSPWHYLISRWRARWRHSAVQFYCRDFWQINLHEADIIYLFLVPAMVKKLWPKIQQETKSGTKVIILGDHGLTAQPVQFIALGSKPDHGFYIYEL